MTPETGPRPPASIRDVARAAGVSHQTVSRVLNDHPSIRSETRQRVLDAMHLLEFRPNPAARRLASRRSSIVGVLVTARGPYYGPASIISAIEDAAREAGYSTLLATPRQMEPDDLADALKHLVLEGVDGIVMLAPQARAAAALATLRVRVPVAMVQSEPGLSVDNDLGGALAAGHLLDLGHRRIALVTGPEGWTEAETRRRGFERALAVAGLTPVATTAGDWTAQSGYEAFAGCVAHRPTAVFCANDQMALGFVHAAADHGLHVPTDLSVVGFDDVPEARHYRPPLTTVRQDLDTLGRRAVRSLLAHLADSAAYDRPVPPELVVRASTGPAPSPSDTPRIRVAGPR